MSIFKSLLEQNTRQFVVGRETKTGKPFVFLRTPGEGGLLYQGGIFDNVAPCALFFITEDGEIEQVVPVLGSDFKDALRETLPLLGAQGELFPYTEKILAAVDSLMTPQAEEVM